MPPSGQRNMTSEQPGKQSLDLDPKSINLWRRRQNLQVGLTVLGAAHCARQQGREQDEALRDQGSSLQPIGQGIQQLLVALCGGNPELMAQLSWVPDGLTD